MKVKSKPIRRCSGCGERLPKDELIRVVRTPETVNKDGQIIEKSEILVDFTGKISGRGAYVCNNVSCLKKIIKSNRFGKALHCKIPDEIFDTIGREIGEN